MNPNTDDRIKAIIEGARANLAEDGGLTPMFFVYCEKDDSLCACQLEILDGHKEELAEAMRAFAKSKGATWILFMTECYMKKFDKTEDMPRNGAVKDIPGRDEGVIFCLETLTDGDYKAMAVIKYKADVKVIEEINFEKSEQADEGTFTNLLGNKVLS